MKLMITRLLILATSVVALAQAEKPATPPDPVETLRFTAELTDGSRIVGSPVTDGMSWKTGFGVLNLKWNLLKSIEKTGDGDKFSVGFLNGDLAKGTPEIPSFSLHTVLGELNVPLALTRRIGIETLAAGAGPVAYWSFNDPANLGADESGHNHNLTAKGALPTDGRFGKAAATGEVQGVGNCLIIDNHPDLQFSGDFTLALWAWRSAPKYDGDQIIGKEGEFSLRRYQIPTERYDLELFSKQGLSLAKVSETQSGLPLEQWTLIVVTRKDNRMTIRVNDLPAVEVQVTPGEVGSDKPLIIGCSHVGYPWHGKLDEIKKWNYALSDEEQRELFQEPPARLSE